jgi:hypothetical protein
MSNVLPGLFMRNQENQIARDDRSSRIYAL